MNLVLVNGPCGAGKTTVSELLFDQIPGSVLVQTDSLRKTIPESLFATEADPAMARMWRANELGRSVTARVLGNGQSVIVDSIKYQRAWMDPWEELGHKFGARVLDVCITAPREVIEERAASRGYKPNGRLTPQKVEDLYDKVAAFYQDRPDAVVIDSQTLRPQEVADTILGLVE